MSRREYTAADGSALHVTATAERGYFSVTADWPSQRAGGCLHEEVAAAAPALKPLIALHLSDAQTGEPMHAEANGFYWLAGAAGGLGQTHHGANSEPPRTGEQCLSILAQHLRISEDEARQMTGAVARTHAEEGPTRAREVFSGYVEFLRGEWAAEAAAGRALLASLDANKAGA
ncbi:MAG TPA: hypothetical protein P5305_04015 [Rubrivivax sp.]|nr:hypothetical protein [Rubrivivax sp.]HRY87028.1 hypothetical protein [Rubrivivax sp.]